MRIAHIIPGLNMGGTQAVVLSLVSDPIFADDYKIVVGIDHEPGSLLRAFNNNCQSVYAIQLLSSLSPFRPYRVYKILNKKFRMWFTRRQTKKMFLKLLKENIDIIHIHILDFYLLKYVLYYANKFSMACIVTFHKDKKVSPSYWHNFLSFIEKKISCPVVFTQVSSMINQDFLKFAVENNIQVRIIPNGVDLGRFTKNGLNSIVDPSASLFNKDQLNIISVGRLTRVKGQDILLSAVSRMKHKEKVILTIVGDGEELDNLKNLVHTLKLSNQVQFLGERNDIPYLLSHCEIFVLPSRSEGFGLTLVEAMAAGLSCITTNVGPCASIVQEGISGLVVPANDDIAMAEALDMLVEAPGLREGLSKHAVKRALDFDVNQMIKSYKEIYDTLLAG